MLFKSNRYIPNTGWLYVGEFQLKSRLKLGLKFDDEKRIKTF